MSYSRWSQSAWYTYSDVYTVNDEPTLNINCDDRYPLSQLINNKKAILDKYRAMRFDRNPLNYQGEGDPPKDHYKEEEVLELEKYIDWFIEDKS